MRLKITRTGKLVEKKSVLIKLEGGKIIGRVWQDDILLDTCVLTMNQRPCTSKCGGSI
jgi:hypothetical protein